MAEVAGDERRDRADTENMVGASSVTDGVGAAKSRKVPAFSKSQQLRETYAEVVRAAAENADWRFDLKDISHELPRGQIAKALFDLDQYIRDAVLARSASEFPGSLSEVVAKIGVYVMELFLEAEWLCLSKGFSSTCTALLRRVDATALSAIISQCLRRRGAAQEKEALHRRISDLHALANCDELLKLMGDDALWAGMRMVAQVGFETHRAPERTGIVSASDAVSYHKSRISALKALNLLLFNRRPRRTLLWRDQEEREELNRTLRAIMRVMGSATSDRDVLCQCGASAVGLLHAVHYADAPTRFEEAIGRFLGAHDRMRRKFEGDEGACLTADEDALGRCDFARPEELADLLLSLPSLGCLSIVRGMLTFLYSVHAKADAERGVSGDKLNGQPELESSHPCSTVDQGPTGFMVEALRRCHRIFKTATDTCLRVDINYATLQGVQLMMSFITKHTFHCDVLYQCLLELPELIFTFWTRKVRRISNLAVCTWMKLMELSFALADEEKDPVVVGYTQRLVQAATVSFGSNLKLRYLALQNLLRYVGPEEILRMQPFLIPHLFCSLSVPAIKGCATVFLTELLTKVYETAQGMCRARGGEVSSGIKTGMLALQCLTYPTVIAVLHSRQLQMPCPADGRLAPPQDVSKEQLELRACALADSFKNIFGKIHKDYVFEMLRLSTCFTKCDFYQCLSKAEQEALNAPGPYLVKPCGDFAGYIGELVGQMGARTGAGAVERIMRLEAPFNFAESICLWNARGLNSVEFVEAVVEGEGLQGVVINDSPGEFRFDPRTLGNYPQVRLFYIPLQKMRDGLTHIKSDLCLNVLKAVACSPKTKQPVDRLEMELMLYALHHCMKTSLPSFRQHFVASVKPFIRRMLAIVTAQPGLLEEVLRERVAVVRLDHTGFVLRTEGEAGEGGDDARSVVARHCAYMRLMLEVMMATINPCTSDFKNTTALELLHMTFQMLAEEGVSVAQLGWLFTEGVIAPLYMALFYMSTRQQELIMKILLMVPAPVLREALRRHRGGGTLGYVVNKAASSLWSVKTLPYMAGSKALALLLRGVPGGEGARRALEQGDLVAAVDGEGSDAEGQHEVVICVLEYLLRQLEVVCGRLDVHVDVNEPERAACPAGLLSLISHYMDSIPVSCYSKVVNTTRFAGIVDAFYANAKRVSNHILKYVGRESDLDDGEARDYQIDCRGHLITQSKTYDFDCTSTVDKNYLDCCLCGGGFECFKVKLLSTPKCSVPDDSNLRPFTVLCWKSIFEFCAAMRSMLQWILPQTRAERGGRGPGDERAALLREDKRHGAVFDHRADVVQALWVHGRVCGPHDVDMQEARHFGATVPPQGVAHRAAGPAQGLRGERRAVARDVRDAARFAPAVGAHRAVLHVRPQGGERPAQADSAASGGEHAAGAVQRGAAGRRGEGGRARGGGHPDTLAQHPVRPLPVQGAAVVEQRPRGAGALREPAEHGARRLVGAQLGGAALFLGAAPPRGERRQPGVDGRAAGPEDRAVQQRRAVEPAQRGTGGGAGDDGGQRGELRDAEPGAGVRGAVPELRVCLQLPQPDTAVLVPAGGRVYAVGKRGCDTALVQRLDPLHGGENPGEELHGHLAGELVRAVGQKLPFDFGGSELQQPRQRAAADDQRVFAPDGSFTLDQLSEVENDVASGRLSDVEGLLTSQSHANVVLVTLYVVTLTARCFENVVQVLAILEKLWLLHGKTASFEDVAVNLEHAATPGNAQVIECGTLLALIASSVLGGDVHRRCRQVIKVGTQRVSIANGNLETLLRNFDRIREDDMVKVKAASTLVDAVFLLTRSCAPGYEDRGDDTGPFVEFCGFLLRELRCNSSRPRVLEAALERVAHLVERQQLMRCNAAELRALWEVGLCVMSGSPQFFVYISTFRLFNALGLQQLGGGQAAPSVFGEAWAERFRSVVSERMLYNSAFLVESWRSCHLYALLRGSDVGGGHILALGAGMLLKAIDPGMDVAVRTAVAETLCDTGLPPTRGGRYEKDASGMYALHAIAALLVMLQDESEGVRAMAVSCCARVIQQGASSDLASRKAHICMERLLAFALSALPAEWAVRLFDQLTMLDADLYNQINYKLERVQQGVLQRRVSLTTAALDCAPGAAGSLAVLAEMDTVFNVEPQNMYTETLLYMVQVDRLLCRFVRSCADGGTLQVAKANTAATLCGFVRDNAVRIMGTLESHLLRNYEIDARRVPEAAAHALAADPLVLSCCVAGFARSCLYVMWPQGSCNGERGQELLSADWERVDVFRRLLATAGKVWEKQVNEGGAGAARAAAQPVLIVFGFHVGEAQLLVLGRSALVGLGRQVAVFAGVRRAGAHEGVVGWVVDDQGEGLRELAAGELPQPANGLPQARVVLRGGVAQQERVGLLQALHELPEQSLHGGEDGADGARRHFEVQVGDTHRGGLGNDHVAVQVAGMVYIERPALGAVLVAAAGLDLVRLGAARVAGERHDDAGAEAGHHCGDCRRRSGTYRLRRSC
ncbi:thyroid adenoma-associated protein, putative [Babesia caballi]|uniref:Thyroid adenoma-associated protein, putative n=1 Tax=Babesia caballi TaxID=5871 RepID=A0AAV4M365_BABCB|nr:thyroid adenoma-associated protein, putative [Babesia caballi]